jgi:hypothetical protein
MFQGRKYRFIARAKCVVIFGRSIEGVIDALTRSGGECGRGID